MGRLRMLFVVVAVSAAVLGGMAVGGGAGRPNVARAGDDGAAAILAPSVALGERQAPSGDGRRWA